MFIIYERSKTRNVLWTIPPSQQPLQTCVRCLRKYLCDRCAQDLQPSTCRPALLTCWCCPPPSLPLWWFWGSWQRAIKKVRLWLVYVEHLPLPEELPQFPHTHQVAGALKQQGMQTSETPQPLLVQDLMTPIEQERALTVTKQETILQGCATAGSLLVVGTSYSDPQANSNTPSYILALYPSPKIEFMIVQGTL